MPVISSRQSTGTSLTKLLQDTLLENFDDIYQPKGDEQLPTELSDLVVHTCAGLETLRMTLDTVENELEDAEEKVAYLEGELDKSQDLLANLIGDIGYDEALDHATLDLMDCLIASGAAEPTADGELGFDERVTLNKEDIKPMLREAIVRWIELRISQ